MDACPPGILVLAPGEMVTAEIVEALRAEALAGRRLAGASDPSLGTLLVVRVVPADSARSAGAIEALVGTVLAARAVPVILGGDHSTSEPNVLACSAAYGPVGVVHFDSHADTGTDVFGVEISHGTPFYRLVERERIDPRRYVQIGLRGYWPGETEFVWQAERGITSFFMHDLRDLGVREVVRRSIELVGAGPVFLTIDIDVLDPAFAPGTGTPEPGGMTTVDLLWAVRTVATELELVGADLVEVIPTAVGSADVTALAADRIVREILAGIAIRKRISGEPARPGPQTPPARAS